MTTKTYRGETFTEVGPGEWRGEEFTTPWDVCEIEDLESKISWAKKELAKISRGDLEDEDVAAEYLQTMETWNEAAEALELLKFLAA